MNNKLHDLTFKAERCNYFCRKSYKTALLLLVALMSTISVVAQNVTPKVTLNITNSSIEAFFITVEKQSGYKFLYRKDIIDVSKKVTVNCTDKPLTELLNEQLPKLNLNYKFTDKTIVLSQRTAPKVNEKMTITGKVIDAQTKSPIAGATIIVKGTSVGAISDSQGGFSFSAKLTDEIEISFVGMVTINRVIKTERIVVDMKEDVLAVEDVVITGYQTIDRKLFTGSASKLNADKTLLKASGDITTSLQGKVSGVQISNVSSTFGTSPILTIRGNSSINGTNKPLWVVDGVVLEDLMTVSADELTSGNLSTLLSSGVAGLNQEDISSFEILKDVSATSLYGAQAMNGVIVITTKKGKKDRLSVNYSGSIAIKSRPNYSNFDIMNSVDEMSIYKELERKGWIDITTTAKSENFGAMGKMFDQIAKRNINWGANGGLNEEFLNGYANSNTDWFNELFKNSIVNQHSISLSGGGAKSTFYASLSYYGDAGMAKAADKVDRYTASLRGDFDLTTKIKLGIKLSANIRDQRVPGTKDRNFDSSTGVFVRDFDINPFNYVLNTSRSMRAYDDNGNLEYFRRSFSDFNIIHELNNNFVDVTVNDISSQIDLEYKPIKTLTLRGALQYRSATTLSEHKIHESSNQAEAYRATSSQAIIDLNRFLFTNPDMPTSNPYSILPEGGFYNTRETELRHAYFRATADYSPKIGGKNVVNFFAGFEMNMVNRKNRENDGWGYIWDRGGVTVTHPDLMKYLKSQGQDYFGYSENNDRRISTFLNGAYSYAGKYVFNAGFRYDGSNQLGRSRTARYLPSWNVSAAWNMHEEDFMKGTSTVISLLKPKVSYGYNGIMGPNTSAELAIFADQTLRPTDNEVFNRISALRNDDLTWEKMAELNLGLEMSFLSNAITLDFAYYNRKSTDLIDIVTTSGIGGVSSKYGNIGNMKSSGYEVSINTTNIQKTNFSWRTNFNVNFHRSEITKLNNSSRIGDAISNVGVAMLGYPQRGLFSTRFATLDNKGVPTFYGENNEKVYDMNMQSRDNIETILKYEGPFEPRSYGGLNNYFTYRNWGLNFGLVYKYGNVIRLDDKFYSSYNDYSSFTQDLKNRWIMPGDENKTTIPAILDKRTDKQLQGQNAYQLYNKSSERVAKGDFIRLKDVSVQYSLPRQLLSKSFLTGATISFQATNLWLLYSDKKLNGLDPEFFLSGGVSSPISTSYTFTLNLSF